LALPVAAVFGQAPVIVEFLVRVIKKRVVRVLPQMSFETARALELFFAVRYWTSKLLYCVVSNLVSLHVTFGYKMVVAVAAPEGPLPRVRANVRLEVARLVELLEAAQVVADQDLVLHSEVWYALDINVFPVRGLDQICVFFSLVFLLVQEQVVNSAALEVVNVCEELVDPLPHPK
jgi:hypothetical protein